MSLQRDRRGVLRVCTRPWLIVPTKVDLLSSELSLEALENLTAYSEGDRLTAEDRGALEEDLVEEVEDVLEGLDNARGVLYLEELWVKQCLAEDLLQVRVLEGDVLHVDLLPMILLL